MKSLLAACGLSLFLSVCVSAQSMDLPWQHDDGSITLGDRTFGSWAEYHQSDLFPDGPPRCATPDPQIGEGPAPGLMGGGPSDCTISSNNPSDIYDPSVVTYRIPVVVHVIRNSSGTQGDISIEKVESGIRILNEDINAIAGTNGALGNDARMEFYLADTDPQGNPTNGITFSNNDTWFNDGGNYWNSLAWDPARYMNVYTNTASGNLGYVPFFPQDGNPGGAEDRVVVLWTAYGEDGPYGPPFDQGRTLTHEVGHYLGLFHVFDGCGGDCSTSGDLVCDTNPQSSPTSGCSSANSCSTPDNIDNYMDYSHDLCMEQFTPLQNRRMRCTLEHYRPLLYTEVECPLFSSSDTDGDGTPDCDDGCPDDPNKIDPGLCGCGNSDVDSDLDGTPDCTDGCPNDVNKTEPGACGCGESDEDLNKNGIPDCKDDGKGQTIVVDDDLQQDPDADFTQIQDAVDAAGEGATILVQPGRYTSSSDNVVFIENKGIQLIGVGGYSEIIIDCEGSRGGIRGDISSANTLVIQGFTVESYSGCFSAGGDPASCNSGIYVRAAAGSTATVDSCVIRDGDGFALTIVGRSSNIGDANLLVRDTMVLNNIGPSNAGADWLMATSYSAIRFENCSFIGNTAGQMMLSYIASPEFTNCVFVDNELVATTAPYANAVLFQDPLDANDSMEIDNCLFIESSSGCIVQANGTDAVQIQNSFACDSSGIPSVCGNISNADIKLTDVCLALDCNENGITDAIEIFEGSAADIDNNGVIDCCESGQPCRNFIQWKTEDGGNGHWYQRVPSEVSCGGSSTTQSIVSNAEALGGHLVTFNSQAEWDFVTEGFGGLQPGKTCVTDWFIGFRSGNGGNSWSWVTGEPVTYTNWGGSNCGAGPYPNNAPNSTLAYASHRSDCGIVWDDGFGTESRDSMVEFSADCNGDGIVDFGQILDGTFSDDDQDGVPDCCDGGQSCSCLGDVNDDQVVNAADLGILLALWGGDGDGIPAADVNGDGTVGSADLGILLSAWGPCAP